MALERTGRGEVLYACVHDIPEEHLFHEAVQMVSRFKDQSICTAHDSSEKEKQEAVMKNTKLFKEFAARFYKEICKSPACPNHVKP